MVLIEILCLSIHSWILLIFAIQYVLSRFHLVMVLVGGLMRKYLLTCFSFVVHQWHHINNNSNVTYITYLTSYNVTQHIPCKENAGLEFLFVFSLNMSATIVVMGEKTSSPIVNSKSWWRSLHPYPFVYMCIV